MEIEGRREEDSLGIYLIHHFVILMMRIEKLSGGIFSLMPFGVIHLRFVPYLYFLGVGKRSP